MHTQNSSLWPLRTEYMTNNKLYDHLQDRALNMNALAAAVAAAAKLARAYAAIAEAIEKCNCGGISVTSTHVVVPVEKHIIRQYHRGKNEGFLPGRNTGLFEIN